MPRRRKIAPRSARDSLIETGIEILANVAGRLFDRWWNSPPQPAIRNHGHSEPPAPKKPKQRRPPAWWRVLGVAQDASTEDIKRAYRDLIARSHPDKVTHLSAQLRKVAEREAKKLNAAYEEALNSNDRNG